MNRLSNGQALLRWVDAASAALDESATVDQRRAHLLALLARPEAPGKLANGVTYYLQQQTALHRELMHEKLPDISVVGAYRFELKRELRASWEAEAEHFGAEHNAAVALAQGFCVRQTMEQSTQKRAMRPSADQVRSELLRAAIAGDHPTTEDVAA